MRFFRWGMMAILFALLGAALYQTLLWLGLWGSLNEAQVKAIAEEDQEIALIEPATNIDEWGRLVTALKLLEIDWPKINPNLPLLQVSLQDAFPQLTAEVPEIVLNLALHPQQQLRLRWYKISGEHDAASWIHKLSERPKPPLAIMGGGTSNRAVQLAQALRVKYSNDLTLPAPLLLITTATAEKTTSGQSLSDIYQGRTFRFSFTNRKMVEALLQFVQHRHYPTKEKEWAQNLWVDKQADPAVLAQAVGNMVGVGQYEHACVMMRAFPHLLPYTMYTISWQDERYSLDMADLFEQEFKKRYSLSEFFPEATIRYGVGEFFQPAPQEQAAVGTFLARAAPVTPHSFLVLPTQTVRMRRLLINLRQRSPLDARNLVIFNGDAISFHSVYRDREVLWNILDLPYSLIFFSHRNPVDHQCGFRWAPEEDAQSSTEFPSRTTTGSQDILLFRDLLESMLHASYDQGHLIQDAIRVRQRMQATQWYLPTEQDTGAAPHISNREVQGMSGISRPFFDLNGNRQSQTGEHIIWIKPNFSDDRVDLTSKISVWTVPARVRAGAWHLVEAYDATYNQSRQEETAP